MECQRGGIPEEFPKEDVDRYRIVVDQGRYYCRVEIRGKPYYFTLDVHDSQPPNNGQVKQARVEVYNDTPCLPLNDLLYWFTDRLNEFREEVVREFDSLLNDIAEGSRDISRVKGLRVRVVTVYTDASTLLYITKRLSQFLDKEMQSDVQFTYERAETLLLRTSDLLNIYLAEVQNDLNQVIKKLTSVTFVFMPLTAVASIYAVSYSSLPTSLFTVDTAIFLGPALMMTALIVFVLRRIGWL